MFRMDDLDSEIEAYLRENWETIVRDIDTLVRIPSVEDLDAAAPGAPFGPEAARALSAALGIAERLGFASRNCDGYIGYADFEGETPVQVGIIGHTDVVPAGPGWNFPAFEVTRKDGYLVGRGVSDDKGPLMVALHAAAFWRERLEWRGERFPYTLRVLFGANEETGMGDVVYYRQHFDDPAFLFTPDADFPVGYGEAGICQGELRSAPIAGGRIHELAGGVAANAVPGEAQARVAVAKEGSSFQLQGSGCVDAEVEGDAVVLHAHGKSAHASTPELGENAIDALAAYLLDSDLLLPDERAFLELVRKVTSCTDGSGVGLQCSDEHFGGLTATGSMIALDGDCLVLTVDFRYPTVISSAEIEARMNEVAAPLGARFAIMCDKPTYLIEPDSPAIEALSDAYKLATGEDVRPFALKGGTYAREFPYAASFGAEKSWESKPDWAGGMHAADEAASEDLLKQAFAVYAHAIGNLMQLDLE